MVTNSKEYMREWRLKNRVDINDYMKKYRANNPIKFKEQRKKSSEYNKEYSKKYNRVNKKILREKKKLQIANNLEYRISLRKSKKNWRNNNKEYANDYNKNRRIVDLSFKLRMNLRGRLYRAMKGLAKQGSAIRDLGCSLEEFKIYIQNKFTVWMSWENYGEWELDHIKPLAKFDLTNREEVLKACHYTNLQPLWKSHNRAKRDKFNDL